MNHTELILAGHLYRCRRFAYDVNGDLEYEGYHLDPNAADDDKHWLIFKHTYDNQVLIKTQGPLRGAFANRASLDW